MVVIHEVQVQIPSSGPYGCGPEAEQWTMEAKTCMFEQ